MAYICLKDQLSGTVDAGGVWTWEGPNSIDIDIQGQANPVTLAVGATIPGGDNPCVDPDTITGLTSGTYTNAFKYCGTNCGATSCSYVDLVLNDAPCAGANTTTTHCVTVSSQFLMNDRLVNAACGKGNQGNWIFISGSDHAHLSNDGNAANDYFIPSEFPVGTHVYRKTATGAGCPNDTADLTIVIEPQFNAGGASRTVTLCDYTTSKSGNLLDLLNQRLADLGQAPASSGGQWEVQGWSSFTCLANQATVMDIDVNSGGCAQYSSGTILAGGADNPHVDFSCYQNLANASNGHFRIKYKAPAGAACPGAEYIHCFVVEDCPGPSCTAGVTISESGCVVSSSISGTCGTPTYQWQRQNGAVWDDIAGETGSTYTSTANETVRVQVSCSDGCSYTSPPLSVSCANNNCLASVSLSASGCNLSSSITGTCNNPTYQWVKWNNGWQNIPGATSSTYTATENGDYALDVTCDDGCTYFAPYITVNKSVTIAEQNCVLTANPSGFDSPTYQWQKLVGGVWTIIAGETSSTYTATENNSFRVLVQDTGGCEFISNTITQDCSGGGGGGGCGPLTVNMSLINGDTQIQAVLSGCTNIGAVNWFYSLSGGSCATASGWSPVSNPPSCNGQSTCVLTPVDGAACYRVFFNCSDGGGCLETGEIYFEPACLASVEIERTDCDYDIRSYKEGDDTAPLATLVTWTDHMKLVHTVDVQAYENCTGSSETTYQGTDTETILTEYMGYPYALGGVNSLVINEYIEHITIYRDVNGSETAHDLDLSTVVYTGQSASAFASALEARIVSQMTALGLTQNTNYQILQVACSVNGTGMSVTINLAARDRQTGETWAGVKKSDAELKINGGGSPRTYSNAWSYTSYFFNTPQTVTRTTPCGLGLSITVQNNNSPAQITVGTADYNTIPDRTTNDGIHQKSWNGNNRTCIELDATITGTCTNPIYAWNGGNTTAQKIVTPGSGYHTVTVDCDDGCSYSDNITV